MSRLQYTTDIRLIRVMCAGRVDLSLILRAFSRGADGVLIIGCRLNECNYTTHGNYSALNKVLLGKRLLQRIGLIPERLRVEFMSSGEGQLFAETVNDFVNTIKEAGPLGIGENADKKQLKSQLLALAKLTPYLKIILKDKLAIRPESAVELDQFYTSDEIDKLLDQVASYYIDPARCQACLICMRKCPVDAISGGKNLVHVIDQDKCIKCGTCLESCPPRFAAIRKIVSDIVPASLPEDARVIDRKSKET